MRGNPRPDGRPIYFSTLSYYLFSRLFENIIPLPHRLPFFFSSGTNLRRPHPGRQHARTHANKKSSTLVLLLLLLLLLLMWSSCHSSGEVGLRNVPDASLDVGEGLKDRLRDDALGVDGVP
jgi:hypothetical protein